MKKISVILLITVLFSSFSQLVYASPMTYYEPSAPYKESAFYKTVTDLPLTGDNRYDVVNVAITQLGYHEGDSDDDMHGTSKGGRNFVEYNVLFGKVDNGEGNGTSYGYMWCASFVNWVLRAANVDTELTGQFISCASWLNFFEGKGQFYARETGYVPTTGDIIYYKGSRTNARSNHIGIVVGSKDGVVYTIEGNTAGIDSQGDPTDGGVVARKNYSLNDTYIVGYGVPDYEVKEGTNYDFELFEINPMTPGEYTVLNSRARILKNTSTNEVLARLSAGTTVEIKSISSSYGVCEYEGEEGYISLSNVMKKENALHKISFVTDCDTVIKDGEKHFGEAYPIPKTVPEKKGHKFVGWAVREGGQAIYSPSDRYTYDLDTTFYAVFEKTADIYTVTFKDGDSIISEKQYLSGETVEIPEISKTDDKGKAYTLSWDKEISNTANGDAVYQAVWTLEEEKGTSPLVYVLIAVTVLGIGAVIAALKVPSKKKTEEKETSAL